MDEKLNKPDIDLTKKPLEGDISSKETTKNLFQKEQDLLNTMNLEFSSSAKEELQEMKNKYEKAKNRNKEGLYQKLNKYKIEFREDIKGLNKISKFNDIPNYDIFKDLIISNSLGKGGRLEEKIFDLFNKYSDEQIRRGIGKEFPVDESGVKVMKKNIEKNLNIEKIKEKLEIKNNLDKLLSNIDSSNIEEIQKYLIEYNKKYGIDEFYTQGLIEYKNYKQEQEREKQEQEREKQEQEREKQEQEKKIKQEKKETEEEKKETEEEMVESNLNIKKARKKIDKTRKDIGKFSEKVGEKFMNKYFPNKDNAFSLLNEAELLIPKENEIILKKKRTEIIKEIGKKISEAKSIIDSIPQDKIKLIFAELKEKHNKEKEELRIKLKSRNIDINSVEGQEEVRKLDSYKEISKVYGTFKNFSPILSQKVDSVVVWPPKNDLPVTQIEKWQLENAGINVGNSKIDGEIIFQNGEDGIGKMGDLSKIPPEIFLVTKNGFKLETKLPKIPDDLTYKREELSKNIIENNKQITKKSFSLKERIKNYNEKIQNGEDISEIKSVIIKLQNEIKDLKDNSNGLIKVFVNEMNKYNEIVKLEQEEKEKKQKETLKFLGKIGFDLVPQYLTKQLIENINFAPKTYGFDAKIDLENGDLGIRGFGNDYMSSEYKDEFMKIFIKAIGNPQMNGKNIFNENNINNGANIIDSSKLDLYLNANGYKGFGAFEKMKANLLDSKQEKNPI